MIDTVADVAIVAERFAVIGQENKQRWVCEGPQLLELTRQTGVQSAQCSRLLGEAPNP